MCLGSAGWKKIECFSIEERWIFVLGSEMVLGLEFIMVSLFLMVFVWEGCNNLYMLEYIFIYYFIFLLTFSYIIFKVKVIDILFICSY